MIVATLVLHPSLASAHQPLFVGPEHSTAEMGPRIVDGTVSFAVYGTLDSPDATRGFRFSLRAGDPLFVELLIPDQQPERTLRTEHLPTIDLIAPDGSTSTLESALGEPFDEPFSGTRYIRLASTSGEAVDGTYAVLIRGAAPSRFTAVVGNRETGGEVDGAGALGSVADWWATPPPSAVPPPSPDDSPQDTLGVEPDPSTAVAGGDAFGEAAGADASGVAEREPAVQVKEPASNGSGDPVEGSEPSTAQSAQGLTATDGVGTAINVGIGAVLTGAIAMGAILTFQAARQRRSEHAE